MGNANNNPYSRAAMPPTKEYTAADLEAAVAHEREQCARVCATQRMINWPRVAVPLATFEMAMKMADVFENAIRARGATQTAGRKD